MTSTLFDATVLAAADRVAAVDHIPTATAHDVVSGTAGLACATKLREIAAAARQTVNTATGCHRVVRADDLLRIAGLLEADAADSMRTLLADARNRRHTTSEADLLRAELHMLRAQHTAVVDELVRRRLLRCEAIGEHPLTPEQRAELEADTRAAWAAIALAGGER